METEQKQELGWRVSVLPIPALHYCEPLPEFCESSTLRRVEKIRMAVSRLHDLEDSQMETTLLRSCLSLPKFNFALRTCPPSAIQFSTAAFDYLMRDSLSDLAGGPVSDWSWLKASLPSSFGGLNLRSAQLHAPAAFVSSMVQSSPLVARILGFSPSPSDHLSKAVLALSRAAARPDWVAVEEIDVPLHQRALSKEIDVSTFNSLLASASDTRSRALAMSSALPHAGDWLNVVPSPALGLHLQDREFRLCLGYWLGLRLMNHATPCPCCSTGKIADPLGDHHVGCGGNGGRIHRHDSLRDALFAAAQSAALAPRKEVPALIPGSASRPADVFLPNWNRGRPAALDVTVISTLQDLTVAGAAATQGHALRIGEERKLAAHQSDCQATGISFVPLVVESLGGWCEEAVHTIGRIGRLLGQRSGVPPAESTRHLFQRLSVCLWRGNATMWLERLPSHSAWVDGII